MTVPKLISKPMGRVSDMVRGMVPFSRHELTADEADVAVYLRKHNALYEGLKAVIEARIGVRATLPVPSDPILCKAMLDRDSELRWLIGHLDYIRRFPAAQPVDDHSEPPA
jgi:hypothetical protein